MRRSTVPGAVSEAEAGEAGEAGEIRQQHTKVPGGRPGLESTVDLEELREPKVTPINSSGCQRMIHQTLQVWTPDTDTGSVAKVGLVAEVVGIRDSEVSRAELGETVGSTPQGVLEPKEPMPLPILGFELEAAEPEVVGVAEEEVRPTSPVAVAAEGHAAARGGHLWS